MLCILCIGEEPIPDHNPINNLQGNGISIMLACQSMHDHSSMYVYSRKHLGHGLLMTMVSHFLDENIEKFMEYSPYSFEGHKSSMQTQIPATSFAQPTFKICPKTSLTIPANIIHICHVEFQEDLLCRLCTTQCIIICYMLETYLILIVIRMTFMESMIILTCQSLPHFHRKIKSKK